MLIFMDHSKYNFQQLIQRYRRQTQRDETRYILMTQSSREVFNNKSD